MTALTAIPDLSSFGRGLNVAVVGSSGGIGNALANWLEGSRTVSTVFRISRAPAQPNNGESRILHLDLERESTIAHAAATIEASAGELHLIIVSTGVLQDGDLLQPEKSWSALSGDAMEIAFRLNATGPALVAKNFLPLLARDRKTAFAAISARVGSVSDNRLGGWYAYRASKAALNMLIKTLSIELARRRPHALCVGLHPGTVDTTLSRPFQRNVPDGKLFSSNQSSWHLLTVLDKLTPQDTGGLFSWDGSPIPI